MSSYNVLSWANENNLTPYPLTKGFGYDGFLVGAQFLQFDGFIPSLLTVKVQDDVVLLSLRIDTGAILVTVQKSDLQTTNFVKKIQIDDRFIGKLMFGNEAYRMVNEEMANLTTKTLNLPFLASTVKTIPSSSGVFSISGQYGEVVVSSDNDIYFDVDGNDVTLNAVAIPNDVNDRYLKTINSTGPLNNSIFLNLPDIVKLSSSATGSLDLRLVGSGDTNNNANHIIVTNG